jgi:hypothetical protein
MIRGILPNDLKYYMGQAAHKRSAQERREEGQALSQMIDDHVKRARADMKRHDLGQALNEIPGWWDCYTRETAKAFRTDETRANYRQAFSKYKAWAEEEELQAIPISAEVLAHYLLHEGSNGTRPDKLKKTASALRFYQSWLEPKHDEVLVNATLAWLFDRWAEDQEQAAEATETQSQQPTANIGPAQH